jgi:hypothetical protein
MEFHTVGQFGVCAAADPRQTGIDAITSAETIAVGRRAASGRPEERILRWSSRLG